MSERTAIVIDDEEFVVSLIETILEDQGFEVLTAYDGTAGWSLIQESQPDIVITDIHMPGMDGMEICRACEPLRRERNFPIFILTGETDRNNKSWASQQDNIRIVSKPFSPRALVEMVHESLRNTAAATSEDTPEVHYG